MADTATDDALYENPLTLKTPQAARALGALISQWAREGAARRMTRADFLTAMAGEGVSGEAHFVLRDGVDHVDLTPRDPAVFTILLPEVAALDHVATNGVLAFPRLYADLTPAELENGVQVSDDLLGGSSDMHYVLNIGGDGLDDFLGLYMAGYNTTQCA